jgi:hypothetical protein
MLSRSSNVHTAFHVTVADVTSAKQAELQENALKSINTIWH